MMRTISIIIMLTLVMACGCPGRGSAHRFSNPSDPLILVTEAPRFDGTFRLSAALQDHMVLQRKPAAATVWGFAAPGTTVTTTIFGGTTITSKAGADSVWRAKLPPSSASSSPSTLHFNASSGETATLSDVLFGDVYLCGGQSNMQFSLGVNENAKVYAAQALNYPNIRLFTVGQKTSSSVPLPDLRTIAQNWTSAATPGAVSDGSFGGHFSAVCKR